MGLTAVQESIVCSSCNAWSQEAFSQQNLARTYQTRDGSSVNIRMWCCQYSGGVRSCWVCGEFMLNPKGLCVTICGYGRVNERTRAHADMGACIWLPKSTNLNQSSQGPSCRLSLLPGLATLPIFSLFTISRFQLRFWSRSYPRAYSSSKVYSPEVSWALPVGSSTA